MLIIGIFWRYKSFDLEKSGFPMAKDVAPVWRENLYLWYNRL